MSEQQKNREYFCYEEDEIDLYELWLTLKKRRWLITITILLSVLLAAAYLFYAKPVYRLEHHFAEPISNALPAQASKGVEVINGYLKSGAYKKVVKILSVEEEKLKELSSISLVIDRKDKGNTFSLIIEGYKKEFLPEFDRAITNYIKELPAVKSALELKREEIKKKIEIYSNKLNELTALSEQVKEKLKSGNISVLGFNPLDIETKLLSIRANIASLKVKLKSLVPFRDIGVWASDKPVKPKKKLVLAVAFMSGLFLGIFLAFFAEWLENVKKREEES